MTKLLAVLILFVPSPAAPPAKQVRLHAIVSARTLYRVNPADATAALKVWGQQVAKRSNLDFDIRVDVMDRLTEIRRRVLEHSADLLILDASEFLLLAESLPLDAVLTVSSQGRPAAFEYLLLAPPAGGATLGTMKGGRIGVASRTGANTGVMWLETLLADRKLGRAKNYFESVQSVEKSSQCVLPVFFGKLNACVVSVPEFEVMREMNPQLNRLKVLHRSEAVLEGLMAMPLPAHPNRKEIVDALMKQSDSAGAAQIMTLFRSGPPILVGPHDLDSMRELYRRYCRINGSCALADTMLEQGKN